MKSSDGIRLVKQLLRGLVHELNRRDQPKAALFAQQSLNSADELDDEIAAWQLGDFDFEPVKSDADLAPNKPTNTRKS